MFTAAIRVNNESAPSEEDDERRTMLRYESCPEARVTESRQFLYVDMNLTETCVQEGEGAVQESKPLFELTAFPLTNRPRTSSNRWLGIFGGHCFAVEGIIGAGKTTLLQGISRYFTLHGMPCAVFQEEVHEELLKKFLEEEANLTCQNYLKLHDSPKRYNLHAFPFQMEMLRRRIGIYKKGCAVAETERKAVFFDRSLPGDVVFAAMHRDAGRMSPTEAALYAEALDEFRRSGDNVDITMLLYLQCDPEQALERVISRTRKSGGGAESGYDLAYMTALTAVYERVLDAHTATNRQTGRTPSMLLDGKPRDVESDSEVLTWVEEVLRGVAVEMFQ